LRPKNVSLSLGISSSPVGRGLYAAYPAFVFFAGNDANPSGDDLKLAVQSASSEQATRPAGGGRAIASASSTSFSAQARRRNATFDTEH
jgi:hypothetical protein